MLARVRARSLINHFAQSPGRDGDATEKQKYKAETENKNGTIQQK